MPVGLAVEREAALTHVARVLAVGVVVVGVGVFVVGAVMGFGVAIGGGADFAALLVCAADGEAAAEIAVEFFGVAPVAVAVPVAAGTVL